MHSVEAAQRIDRIGAAVDHLYVVDGADCFEQRDVRDELHPPVRDVIWSEIQESVDGPFVHGFGAGGGAQFKYAFEFCCSIFSSISVARWH